MHLRSMSYVVLRHDNWKNDLKNEHVEVKEKPFAPKLNKSVQERLKKLWLMVDTAGLLALKDWNPTGI